MKNIKQLLIEGIDDEITGTLLEKLAEVRKRREDLKLIQAKFNEFIERMIDND